MIKHKSGFTLIELLVVVAIIAILVAVVFVALDPLTRFRDSRDSVRWQEISAILNAIKIDQVDNGGDYVTSVNDAGTGSVYMISDGAVSAGCDDQNAYCDTNVTGDNYCINLQQLAVDGYLGDIPVSPNGQGAWTENFTGYTLEKSSTGAITIRACESENSDEIIVVR